MMRQPETDHPHGEGAVIRAGARLADADAAMLLLHGRGAPADDLMPLAEELLRGHDGSVARLAPHAVERQWYPLPFVQPRERNQPWLDSALRRVDELLQEIEGDGVAPERTFLVGFSQGACLALDAGARRGRRLGGVIALSGGLIGERLDEDLYARDVSGTPFFLGCGDPDPHIPRGRVEASGALLDARGGRVDVRIYPGLGHTINEDELEAGRKLVREALGSA